MAAIFDFITEEEWGERGRLRVGGGGGGGGGETTNSRQLNCIDIVLKLVTSENKTIHTRPPPTPPLKVVFLKYFLRVAQTAARHCIEGVREGQVSFPFEVSKVSE